MSERPPHPPLIPLNVCILFEKLSLQVWETGHDRYSADAVLHRIRWHFHVDKGDRSFKANNNWTAHLARWFMQCHPELGAFFDTRASPSPHSREDYMGPVD